jgi:cellobiose PTS system EIIB component
MLKKYSIAEARHDLAAIVKELEQQPVIQITRRGQPVAVLVSTREFERLSAPRTGFWEAFETFREDVDLAKNGLDASFFENLRQKDIGRQVDL